MYIITLTLFILTIQVEGTMRQLQDSSAHSGQAAEEYRQKMEDMQKAVQVLTPVVPLY